MKTMNCKFLKRTWVKYLITDEITYWEKMYARIWNIADNRC